MKDRIDAIKNAYKEILQREGDERGIISYANSNKSIEEIKTLLRLSEEYKEKRKKIESITNNIDIHDGKKILLFGAFGNGNLGDAIQANFVSKGLIEAGFEGRIWATSFLNRHYNFQFGEKLPSWIITSQEILSKFDMLVVGGGGLLSHPHYPLNDNAWANELLTKVALISVGATNFAAHESATLIKKAEYVSARDTVSYNCLKQFRDNVEYVKDPVFSMLEVNYKEDKNKEKTLWILKGPIENIHYKIRNLINKDDIVVGFEKEVDQTIETLFPEIIYTPTIESFNKLAKQCGRFFSMRYHGLIGSLAFSSNVFATSDLKNKLLLEELGMINRYVNEDNLEDIINNPLLSHQDQKPLIERSRKLFIDSLQQILLKIN